MVKLRTYALAALVAAGGMMALAPAASATNYSVCAPTSAVCVGQEDGAAWDCTEGYLAWYGPQYARNGVFISGPGGITADAWAGELCARWFKWSTDQYGATAGAAIGTDAALRASWWHYWHQAAPGCAYGSYSDEGDQLYAAATAAGSTVGVNWYGGAYSACASGSYCHMYLMTAGIADQDLGCVAGTPPAPPSPQDVPYGNIIP